MTKRNLRLLALQIATPATTVPIPKISTHASQEFKPSPYPTRTLQGHSVRYRHDRAAGRFVRQAETGITNAWRNDGFLPLAPPIHEHVAGRLGWPDLGCRTSPRQHPSAASGRGGRLAEAAPRSLRRR